MDLHDYKYLSSLAENINDQMPYASVLEQQLCDEYHLVNDEGYFNRDDSLTLAEIRGEELDAFTVYHRAFIKPSEILQLVLRTRVENAKEK